MLARKVYHASKASIYPESVTWEASMLDRNVVDRFVDIASVVLISIAAVLSAVCGYQAGRWEGEQTRLFNIANANRLLATQQSDRSFIITSINVTLFIHWVEAKEAGNTAIETFIYRRFPPAMRRAVDAWLATDPEHNVNAPSSPFAMPEYAAVLQAGQRKPEATADSDFNEALVAHRNSDYFTLLTVVFAGVSFLAGVSTKLSYPRHAIIVGVGILALLYGLVRLAFLPVI
jgi:hypothetical protein